MKNLLRIYIQTSTDRIIIRKSTIVLFSIVLLICCLFAYPVCRADEKLPPIVVRTTAPDADVYSSPVTGIIIPENQISAGQISGLTDLLKLSNSIFIQDSSYGKQLYLRGMSDQDMCILINGMPLGQLGKYYARSVAWEAIPLENIERIEVVRGVGSAEYGNTLAGTINIITKNGKEKSQSKVTLNYGTFNDSKANATTAGSAGKIDWTLGGAHRSRDEYLNNNDIEQRNASGSVGVDIGQVGALRLTAFTI
ncbi:MAG: TonB-dependent receptor plug domain-containing protein [Proteobacteria bacterium]|nr:TonB-dependent receptor plug domain-containing protein [Pseudomonadota bacterium]